MRRVCLFLLLCFDAPIIRLHGGPASVQLQPGPRTGLALHPCSRGNDATSTPAKGRVDLRKYQMWASCFCRMNLTKAFSPWVRSSFLASGGFIWEFPLSHRNTKGCGGGGRSRNLQNRKWSENQHILCEIWLLTFRASINSGNLRPILQVIRKDKTIYQARNYAICMTKTEHIDRNEISTDCSD